MNTQQDDTIVAISTSPGEAAISIVRISGPEALGIAESILSVPGDPVSSRDGNTFVLGRAIDSKGAAIDEVIVLIYREYPVR